MFGEYKVVHLCGTTRGNKKKFRHVEKELTKMGYIVFKPVFYKLNTYNKYKGIVDGHCYEKLKMCDILCLVGDHIGSSTRTRIEQAKELGKEIYHWTSDDKFEELDVSNLEPWKFLKNCMNKGDRRVIGIGGDLNQISSIDTKVNEVKN